MTGSISNQLHEITGCDHFIAAAMVRVFPNHYAVRYNFVSRRYEPGLGSREMSVVTFPP